MHPDQSYESFLIFMKYYNEYHRKNVNFNEADTRAKIIDFILRDCLGWKERYIKRENPNNIGYTDYELLINEIPILVIEAKKTGEYFDIPLTKTSRNYKINGAISSVKNLKKALFAYSDDSGHPFQTKAATCRSEATLGIDYVP